MGMKQVGNNPPVQCPFFKMSGYYIIVFFFWINGSQPNIFVKRREKESENPVIDKDKSV